MPVRPNPIHILSLGAGVQSSTIALMATLGHVTPCPEFAVFADTMAEPPAVYSWLDWLEKQLAFPVVHVTNGNLGEAALKVRRSVTADRDWIERMLPVFYDNKGKRGMAQRRCTYHYKVKPIRRFQHKFIHRGVTSWIGISTDEAGRMRDSEAGYIQHRYPLIELGMSRLDCLAWMRDHGYPEPPKSSCIFCPFKSNAQWLHLQQNEEISFEIAVQMERRLQANQHACGDDEYIGFLHSSLRNLDTVDFRPKGKERALQNDCSGSCGV